MKPLGAMCTALMLSTSFISPALAATYHVRPGGNNSNSGTSYALAWQTIAKANTAARPGDRIYVWENPSGYADFPNPDSAGSNPAGGGRITFIGAATGGKNPLSDSTARLDIRLPGGDLVKPYTVLKGLYIDGGLALRTAASRCSVVACHVAGEVLMVGCDYSVLYKLTCDGPRLRLGHDSPVLERMAGCTVTECGFWKLGIGVTGEPHYFFTGTTEVLKVDSLTFTRNRLYTEIDDVLDVHPRLHFWTMNSTFKYNVHRIVFTYPTPGVKDFYAMRLRDSTQKNVFVADTIIASGTQKATLFFSATGSGVPGWDWNVRENTFDSCLVNLLDLPAGSRTDFDGGMFSCTMRYNTILVRGQALNTWNVQGKNRVEHNTFVGASDYSPVALRYEAGQSPAFDDTLFFRDNISYALPPLDPTSLRCALWTDSRSFKNGANVLLKSDNNLLSYFNTTGTPGSRVHRWEGPNFSRTGYGGDWWNWFHQDSLSRYGSPRFADSSLTASFNATPGSGSAAIGIATGGCDAGAVQVSPPRQLNVPDCLVFKPNILTSKPDTVWNTGCRRLSISSVTSDHPKITVSPTSAQIDPGRFVVFNIYYLGQPCPGATVTFSSDDPDGPRTTVVVISSGASNCSQ